MNTDNNPILMLNASQIPYLSIGRLTGGIKYNGSDYVYQPIKDAYIRKDYIKIYNEMTRKGKSWDEFVEYVKTIKQ